MKSFFLILSCFLPLVLFGQYNQEILFPDQEGEELRASLVDTYKPPFVFDYGTARDKLYKDVYRYKDSVRCVYSGHALYLPNGVDPSSHLLQNGNSDGINCEHSYPRSKGADEGNPKSDMHHLFPTRAAVNSARSNAPFLEIEDSKTEKWYYKTFEMSAKPSQNEDLYSELRGWSFEPREDHKGNTARAVFYFFTMYESQAMAADPSFFNIMRPTLCLWHIDDPVDSLEWERTHLIAQFQGDRPNPFVLDCTLPERTYCQDMNIQCVITTDASSPQLSDEQYSLYPNPFQEELKLEVELAQKGRLSLELYNVLGQSMGQQWVEVYAAGRLETSLSFERLPPGNYQLQATLHSGSGKQVLFTRPVQKIP